MSCGNKEVSGGGASSETENAIAFTLNMETEARQSVQVVLYGDVDTLRFSFDSAGEYNLAWDFILQGVEFELENGRVLPYTHFDDEQTFALELTVEKENKASIALVEEQICLGMFECGSVFDDRDGKLYPWILLGKDRWFRTDLEFDPELEGVYAGPAGGLYYTWQYIEDSTAMCPSGYSVPNERQWNDLETYTGKSADVLVDSVYWDLENPLINTDTLQFGDPYGLAMQPGGFRDSSAQWQDVGIKAYYWSADEFNDTLAWDRNFSLEENVFGDSERPKSSALKIRCVRRVVD